MDTLSVSPRCQCKGYGRKLIEAGCDRARKLGHHRNSYQHAFESLFGPSVKHNLESSRSPQSP